MSGIGDGTNNGVVYDNCVTFLSHYDTGLGLKTTTIPTICGC